MKRKNYKLPKMIIATLFSLMALFVSQGALAEDPLDIFIIAHKTIPIDSIEAIDVRAVFLKKKTHWPGGIKIEPYNDLQDNLLRHTFVNRVLGLDVSDEIRYWQKENVKHGITPPVEYGMVRRERLRKTFWKQGAISYVYRKDYLENVVKILLVIPAQ